MILRKPYAFVIKHFKLIHLICFVLVGLLIMNTLTTMTFLNEFLKSNLAYINRADFNSNFSWTLLVVPVVILAIFIGISALMYMKQKPIKFYIFSIIGLSLIFAFNIYVRGIMYSMIESMQSVQTIKVLADFLLFSVFFELFVLLTCFIRGIGFNISRFDFNTDLNEMIEENDNEEVEFQFDLDLNDIKRNSNKTKRQIRYFYKENQSIIKYTGMVIIGIFAILGIKLFLDSRKDITRGPISYNDFTFEVVDSYITNTDINYKELDNNTYLIVVKANITNDNTKEAQVFKTGTLVLNLDNNLFKTTDAYGNATQDIGDNYTHFAIAPEQTKEVLFTFAIPKNHIKSKKYIGVRDLYGQHTTYIKLNPEKLYNMNEEKIESKVGKSILLDNSTIKGTEFTIKNVEFAEKFKLQYNYRYSKDKTFASIEYVTPKVLDKKVDKAIMKLNIKYHNKESKEFMYLVDKFGSLEYEIAGKKYTQNKGINRVIPTSIKNNEIYYLEINKNILDADKVTLVFKIRNIEYRYKLK